MAGGTRDARTCASSLDPNLADAHGFIDLGMYQSGHSEEVEGHIQEALRLSPRDTRAFLWYMFVGLGKFFGLDNLCERCETSKVTEARPQRKSG